MEYSEIDFEEIVYLDDAKQYLFFQVGGDTYAIEAHYVREMLEYQSYTKVPHMPSYIKGVSNIRGTIICVMDLLDRLGLGETALQKRSSLIIIDDIALLIDEVDEVSRIEDEDIREALDFGFKIEQRFVKHMARFQGEYIAILDIEEILRLDEISQVEAKEC